MIELQKMLRVYNNTPFGKKVLVKKHFVSKLMNATVSISYRLRLQSRSRKKCPARPRKNVKKNSNAQNSLKTKNKTYIFLRK